MRLSTRTGLATLTAVLVAVVLVAGLVVIQFQRMLYQQVDERLADRARTAPILVAVGERIAASELDQTVEGARIVTDSGKVGIGRLPASPLPDTERARLRTVTIDGEEWRILTIAVEDVPSQGDEAVVELVAPLGNVNDQASRLRRRSIVVGLVVALAAGGLGLLLGRLASAPLVALRHDTARLGSSPPDRGRMRTSYGAPEVDDVATAIGSSLDHLATETRRRELALGAAQSFAAAASHELRTPLQAAMAELDLALVTDDRSSAAAAAHPSIASARAQLDRMAASLAAVRALTEVDLIEPSWFSFGDLSEVADRAVASIPADLLPHATIEFRGDETAPCRVWNEGACLAVSNVIRNALLHGRPIDGSDAVVVVRIDATKRSVTIDDGGPGIPAHDRARLLLPFERGSTLVAGSGLGLAFAARVAKVHGGDIQLAEATSGGTRVTLTFG